MPHITVQLWPGPSEEQKAELAKRIERDVIETIGSSSKSISIAIEEVPSTEWMERVYRPGIGPNLDRLHKKPGYDTV